jgi:hypothetical protein
VVAAFASVGVPDKIPVAALKFKPAGSAGVMTKVLTPNPTFVYAAVAVIGVPTSPATV